MTRTDTATVISTPEEKAGRCDAAGSIIVTVVVGAAIDGGCGG